MKFFIILLSLLSANAVLAEGIGPDSTWKEIADAGLAAEFPAISFGPVSVTVDQICSDKDELRTIDPVTFCVAWNADAVCSERVTKYLETPIQYTYEINTGTEENPQYVTVEAEHVLEYEIAVGEYSPLEGAIWVMFYKKLEITSCGK